jgi:hypothetical protein
MTGHHGLAELVLCGKGLAPHRRKGHYVTLKQLDLEPKLSTHVSEGM